MILLHKIKKIKRKIEKNHDNEACTMSISLVTDSS